MGNNKYFVAKDNIFLLLVILRYFFFAVHVAIYNFGKWDHQIVIIGTLNLIRAARLNNQVSGDPERSMNVLHGGG